MSQHILASLKAYTALLGSIVTALLGIYGPDTEVGHWLTVAAAALTAVSTYAVPNIDGTPKPLRAPGGERPFGEGH